MANRAELEKALSSGCRVAVVTPGARRGKSVKILKELPAGEVEGVVVRTADGRLTHDGMKQAIAEGGSVLWNGEICESLDALPTSADLARGDEQRVAEERKRLLGHKAALDAELAKLETPKAEVQPDKNAPLPEAVPAHPAQPNFVEAEEVKEEGHKGGWRGKR